jgi:hypothetical protein
MRLIKDSTTRGHLSGNFGRWGLETPLSFSDEQINTQCVAAFVEATIGNLLAIFNEIVENPLPAAQSGLAAAAYVFTALSESKFKAMNSEKVTATLKKATILHKALTFEPKPSFLLNHRIYSKLTLKEDSIWAVRALATVSKGLAPGDATSTRGDAWAQALYLITSRLFNPVFGGMPHLLAEAYVAEPATISKVVVEGIWRWRQRIENADRDSAAMTARTGNSKLYLAIRSICLPGVVKELGARLILRS